MNIKSNAYNSFLAGASFAEKEKTLEYKLAIETAAILKEQRDEALGKLGSLENRLLSANSDIQSSHKREKEAHNSAIDKAIDLAYNSGLGDFAVEIGKLKI